MFVQLKPQLEELELTRTPVWCLWPPSQTPYCLEISPLTLQAGGVGPREAGASLWASPKLSGRI